MSESSGHTSSEPAADPDLQFPLDAAALERLRRLGGDALIRRMNDLFLENSELRMESAPTGLAGGDRESYLATGFDAFVSEPIVDGVLLLRAVQGQLNG